MRQKKKKLSLKTTTTLALIIFLLGFGGVMWFYAFYHVVYIKTYDIEIITSPDKFIGLNADPNLHFGEIPETGGISRKELKLFNDKEIPLLVQIRIQGEAAQFITVDDNNFILQPDESRKLSVYAKIPLGFGKLGNYTGEAKIMFVRP